MATCRRIIALAAVIVLCGCTHIENPYHTETVALTGPQQKLGDIACNAPQDAAPVRYDLGTLRDCTAQDTFIVFAFTGGGIRSAAFGYGALMAAHNTLVPDASGVHTLDKDIDVVSGVSGGSFTAAAFATHGSDLFPAAGAPDHYRDNFLTHNFNADRWAIALAPWHWEWMLPNYSSQDEMAKLYGSIDFSSPSDKLFAADFSELAKRGRPLLVVQATDFGNEQPFTFTQPDFDLICSDLAPYPVANAVAASSAFPVLFSPIRLTNHHFEKPTKYCATHRPKWVDRTLSAPEPVDLSRLYARARAAEGYLPSAGAPPHNKDDIRIPRYVFLQDGGVVDNIALRGFADIVIPHFGTNDTGEGVWTDNSRAAACRGNWNRIRRILVVVVDGQAQPNTQVSSLPYLTDWTEVLDLTGSALIDANGFETMLATEAMTRVLAKRLSQLSCDGSQAEHTVQPYFAHLSFQNLLQETKLDAKACDSKKSCTLGDVAQSETSLDFSGPQVDALIAAGRSAFQCNRGLARFLTDIKAKTSGHPPLPCRTPESATQ